MAVLISVFSGITAASLTAIIGYGAIMAFAAGYTFLGCMICTFLISSIITSGIMISYSLQGRYEA